MRQGTFELKERHTARVTSERGGREGCLNVEGGRRCRPLGPRTSVCTARGRDVR